MKRALTASWAVRLGLSGVPGPVLVVPLLVIKAIKVEDGAMMLVALLVLLLPVCFRSSCCSRLPFFSHLH